MIIVPKAIYRVNIIQIKLPMAFLKELEQKFLQFVWKHKRTQIAKVILKLEMNLEQLASFTADYTTKLQ